MGGIVGGILGTKTPKPDPAVAALQAKQLKRENDREEEATLQAAAQDKLISSRGRGRQLLLSGNETGVQSGSATLG
jgi:hypothetical protein